MGFLIVNTSSGNYLASDENHSFTNQFAAALVIQDEDEARAMLKGIRKVDKAGAFTLLQEAE